MESNSGSLRDYTRLEWQHAPRRAILSFAFGGVFIILFTHLVIPLFPDRAIQFMMRGFRVSDMPAVLLINDLMGIYFPVYFLGLASSLGVVLTAREEHRLEILLAKPVRPAQFVQARVMPILAGAVFVGIVSSLACAVAIAVHSDPGASVSFGGAFGAGLALTALALVLVGALQIPFVRLREPFQGLLAASFLFLITTMPSAVLLYRPDAYEGHETLLNTIVMVTLVWHDERLVWLGPVLLVVAIPISLALVRVAGAVLERSDGI